MGTDLNETDAIQIKSFTERVVEQVEFRESLQEYLKQRMNVVAPNLTSLIGETVGSKLIVIIMNLIFEYSHIQEV